MNNQKSSIVEKINDDLFLNHLTDDERDSLSNDFKKCVLNGTVVFAQLSSSLGNVEENAFKALRCIDWAERIEAEAIIFPECFLVGYPAEDLLNKFPHIVEECSQWLDIIASKTNKTKVLIGFVEFSKANIGKKYYNSVAVLAGGKIEKIMRKSVLADNFVFNDSRCFEPVPFDEQDAIVQIGEKKAVVLVGTEVIKDLNNCILEKLVENVQIDFVVNIATEISRIGNENNNSQIMSDIAKNIAKPFLFLNQAGATEKIVYNGASRLYDNRGHLVLKAKHFEEQFVAFSPFENINEQVQNQCGKAFEQDKVFSLDYESDLPMIYETLVFAIRNYFKKTGFKRAVLGLSGGLDSTVSAVILADAIGAENVLGVSMPSVITSEDSKNDAKILAQNLGIKFFEIPVKEMCDTTKSVFAETFKKTQDVWDCRYKQSFTNDNIQARSRAMILWGIANEFESCLPIATSDKSELYMGYATINGDMSGGYAPLADVTKTKLFALAKWMNKHRIQKNAIPTTIIDKRPGAELAINPKTGKPLLAEEALMPYDFMDEVIWRVENLNQNISDMLDVEFLYEKNMKSMGTPISCEQKQEWLQKFFKRMTFALFKWQLMPPSPIVDVNSINSIEYNQSVLSAGINYSKTDYDTKVLQANQIN